MRKSTEDVELTPLVDHHQEMKETRLIPYVQLCQCLCLPLCLIILFTVSTIVLSTQVTRQKCLITCIHRPNCTALINNVTFITLQGSCSWREKIAKCTCYSANGVVTINPFILLSPIWTLVAVLSGGTLVLFTVGMLCRCCRRDEQ